MHKIKLNIKPCSCVSSPPKTKPRELSPKPRELSPKPRELSPKPSTNHGYLIAIDEETLIPKEIHDSLLIQAAHVKCVSGNHVKCLDINRKPILVRSDIIFS